MDSDPELMHENAASPECAEETVISLDRQELLYLRVL